MRKTAGTHKEVGLSNTKQSTQATWYAPLLMGQAWQEAANNDNRIPPRSSKEATRGQPPIRHRRLFSYPKSDNSYFYSRNAAESEDNLWHFSILQSTFYRLWLSRLAQVLVSGALSICLRATATTIRAQMLMYGKEASNRKQEIDRQHYTIPNQRPKDKHCGKI